MTEAGRYDVVAGTTEQPTTVTVLEGSAEIDGPGVSLKIAANQTATVTGRDRRSRARSGPRCAMRFCPPGSRRSIRRPRTASIPAAIPYMSGAEDLSGYGEWSQDSHYGQVWYPPVASGWVPYREGEWAYVQPWGWTWVDSDSWGFAPFHYGRWARIFTIAGAGSPVKRAGGTGRFTRRRWSRSSEPALASRLARRSPAVVGWVPLGPGEAYHPWYHASSGYLQRINAGHVKDPAAIGATVAPRDFANRGAATSVPASVMLGSRPVRQFARPMSEQTLAAAHPVAVDQLVRPTPRTFGVTPAVARQLNLPAAGAPGRTVRRRVPWCARRNPVRRMARRRGRLCWDRMASRRALRRGVEPAGGPRPGEPARPGAGDTGAAVAAAESGGALTEPPPLEAPDAAPGLSPPRASLDEEGRRSQRVRPQGAEAPDRRSCTAAGAGSTSAGVTEPRGAAPAPEAPRGETPGQHPPEAARPGPGAWAGTGQSSGRRAGSAPRSAASRA